MTAVQDAGGIDSPGASLDALVDVIRDAVTDPVSEASAATPDVASEACDKLLAGDTSTRFAVHAYPGKTAAELALVQTTCVRPVSAGVFSIDGHDFNVTTLAVRYYVDGFVAVQCGAVGAVCDSVTFARPQ